MTELKPWEVPTIMEYLSLSVKNDWEMTRMISYWTAKPHYKKLDINNIAKFSWEEDKSVKSEIKTTDEDIKQLKELFRNQRQRGR
jgi:hypothetical protein